MKNSLFVCIMTILLLSFHGCGKSASPVAKIIKFTGKATYMLSSSSAFKEVKVEQGIAQGGSVKTSEDSTAELEFIKDKTKVNIAENTYFEIKDFSKKQLKQMGGVAIYDVSPQDKELTVETPHGMATVLGTVFQVKTADTFTEVVVERGVVQLAWGKNTVKIKAGEYVDTKSKDNTPKPVDMEELERIFNGKGAKINYNAR